MTYVPFNDLPLALKAEVAALRPKLKPDELPRFEFWIKPDGHVSRRGGHHQLTKEAGEEIDRFLKAEPRSKGDLKEWKPGVTFHFDRP